VTVSSEHSEVGSRNSAY